MQQLFCSSLLSFFCSLSLSSFCNYRCSRLLAVSLCCLDRAICPKAKRACTREPKSLHERSRSVSRRRDACPGVYRFSRHVTNRTNGFSSHHEFRCSISRNISEGIGSSRQKVVVRPRSETPTSLDSRFAIRAALRTGKFVAALAATLSFPNAWSARTVCSR